MLVMRLVKKYIKGKKKERREDNILFENIILQYYNIHDDRCTTKTFTDIKIINTRLMQRLIWHTDGRDQNWIFVYFAGSGVFSARFKPLDLPRIISVHNWKLAGNRLGTALYFMTCTRLDWSICLVSAVHFFDFYLFPLSNNLPNTA